METFWLVLTLIIMVIGLVGVILPVLPSVPIIYAGFFIYGLATDWSHYGAATMIWCGILTVVVLAADYAAGALGARRFGGSRAGMIGSILGAIVGLIVFNLIGLIIGTFVGAIAFELLSGRNWEEALRSGWGALVGFLAGSLFKLMAGLMMIGIFIWMVAF